MASAVDKLLRNTAVIYLAAGVLARVGSFLLVPIYTRRLSPAEYSSYATFTTLLPLLVMLYTLGLSSAITRSFYAPRAGVTPEQAVGDLARGILGLGVLFATLGCGLIALVWPAGAMLLDAHQWYLLLWTGVAVALGSVPDVYLTVSQRAWQAASLQFATFVLTAGLGLLFVVGLGRGGRGAIEALALASGLQGLFALGFIARRLGVASPRATLASELKLSLPYIPHTLALWAQQAGDRAVLSAQGRADQLGIYYLAVQLSTPLNLVTSSWNNARVPVLGEAFRQDGLDGAARVLPAQYRQFVAVAGVAAVAMLLGVPFLPWVVGARFAGAASLLPALLLAGVVESLYFPSANYLMIVGHTRLIPVATGLSSALSVGLVLLLLPRYGLTGLLVARVLGACARSLFMGLVVLWYRRPPAASAPA
ncbi:MAG: lipopolysaccharide biosynthesis protein [Myxococcales bacterium]|nr:MAG: lipopolysaccharide biosynthesis protein [Myxococcales bacterium]